MQADNPQNVVVSEEAQPNSERVPEPDQPEITIPKPENASERDRLVKEKAEIQDLLQRPVQAPGLLHSQPRPNPRRMNLRFPQTFIRINIPDAPEHSLVQQHGLDARSPSANALHKFLE